MSKPVRRPANWPSELTVSYSKHGSPASYTVRYEDKEVASVSASERRRWSWWSSRILSSRFPLRNTGRTFSSFCDALSDLAEAWADSDPVGQLELTPPATVSETISEIVSKSEPEDFPSDIETESNPFLVDVALESVPTPVSKETIELCINTLTVDELVPYALYLCVASKDKNDIGEVLLRTQGETILGFHRGNGMIEIVDPDDLMDRDARYLQFRTGAAITLAQDGPCLRMHVGVR